MIEDSFIETERTLIRRFIIDDIDEVYPICSDPVVVQFLPEGIMSYADLKSTLEWIIDMYEKNVPKKIKKLTLAVILKENEKIIGWCGLGECDSFPKEIELFYTIAKEYWGKGLGTEIAFEILRFGLEDIGLTRIIATVDPANCASLRILEKIGMTRKEKLQDGCYLYSIRK